MRNFSSITLHKLKLNVHLGWPDTERASAQIITVEVMIQFPSLLAGCLSDQLTDTYCYDQLTSLIKETASKKAYRLVEHLGHEIYQAIKRYVKDTAKIKIIISKHPAIVDLMGGVTFSLGDEE